MRGPSFEQVSELPEHLRGKVPAEYEDANGHMNISGYMRLHDQALWPWSAAFGVDASYLSERRMTLFDLEHHLCYLAEILTGSSFSIHSRMVDRSEKVLHGMLFLLDLTEHRLSNTLEFVTAHVSLDTRRAVPFPPDVDAALDRAVKEAQKLPWPAPLSGAMGIR